jgi:hypothetical protein
VDARAREAVDRVLADPLYWFPVRHHSPAVARHLRAALRRRRPAVVFIEGPPACTALVPYVVHKDTKPPIALYTSFRDDGNVLGLNGVATPSPEVPYQLASWFPLLAYSPEYVALKTATELGAEVVFMDLPPHARQAVDGEVPDGSVAAESAITTSDFYRGLAKAAGFRTFDETWDALFETAAHADDEACRRDLTAFCAAARLTTDPARSAADGTVARERHMWKTIRGELAQRGLPDEAAFVVCGGFHLFLARDGAEPPPIPEGTVQSTVVPYSYFRASERSGYGAGNRAPRYYQRLWEASEAGATPDDALLMALTDALRAGRKAKVPLSSADAIAVAQTAHGLASLRGRRHALLDDLHDAVVTCCVKGDPRTDGQRLLTAIHEAAVGTDVGKVTESLGRLPLVLDFHHQLALLGLTEHAEHDRKASVDLDRRDPASARRSAFFHRLVRVGIPFAALLQGGSIGTVFRERWRVGWSPEVERALVEAVGWGDTVEAAAAGKLAADVAQHPADASGVTTRWREAVDMDLPSLAHRLEGACSEAIDTDPRAASLATAMVNLGILKRQAAFRGLRKDVVAELESRAYGRACFRLPEAADVPDEEQGEVLTALQALAEAALADAAAFDPSLLEQNTRAAAADTTSPFLRGAFLGMLVEIRVSPPESLAERISAYANALPETRGEAGAFLEGVFAVSRTSLMLGADAIAAAVDELLRSCDWTAFTAVLPRLRHAFARLHDRQRDAFAEVVARRYGKVEARALVALPTSVDAALAMARLDAKVGEILAVWEGA